MKLGWPSRNEMLTSRCLLLFEICSVTLAAEISWRFYNSLLLHFADESRWGTKRPQPAPPVPHRLWGTAHASTRCCRVLVESPKWDFRERESNRKESRKRPKTDLKHSNQSVIWPRAKSMLIISQSEQIGRRELARQVPRGPRGTWTVSSLH